MASKYKIKHKDDVIFIKYSLSKDEKINKRELDILTSKYIRGYMRISKTENKKIVFTSPEGISLSKYLTKNITENDFFFVLAQITEAVKSVDINSLNIGNLVLSLDMIFYSQLTKVIHFIYQPIQSQRVSVSLESFIRDLIDITGLAVNEDIDIKNNLLDYISRLETVDAKALERYIDKVYPSVYNGQLKKQVMKKSDGASLWKDFCEEKEEKGEKKNRRNEENKEEKRKEISSSNVKESKSIKHRTDTELFVEDDDEFDLDYNYENPTERMTDNGEEDEEDLPPTEQMADEYSYFLVRVSTGEEIPIEEDNFKIGRLKGSVDYLVNDNPKISKVHAVFSFNDGLYIKDNNSANGVKINGDKMEKGAESELYDGDEIGLSNEKFIVKILNNN